MPKTMRMTALMLIVTLALGCGAYERARGSAVRGAVSMLAGAILRIESGAPLTQSESRDVVEVAENRPSEQHNIHRSEARNIAAGADDASDERDVVMNDTLAENRAIAAPLPQLVLPVREQLAVVVRTAASPETDLVVRVPRIDRIAMQQLVERARRAQHAAADQERHPMIMIRTCTLPVRPVRAESDDAHETTGSPEAADEKAS